MNILEMRIKCGEWEAIEEVVCLWGCEPDEDEERESSAVEGGQIDLYYPQRYEKGWRWGGKNGRAVRTFVKYKIRATPPHPPTPLYLPKDYI